MAEDNGMGGGRRGGAGYRGGIRRRVCRAAGDRRPGIRLARGGARQPAGLLLGTSRTVRSGRPNAYFYNRVDAAAALYHAGKVEYLVISGDNGRKGYNEPQDMKEALVGRGVPAEAIYLDYAGFRTYDSVVRMEKIFGQESFTVISQEFHNRRAVYIAQALGLDAVGYNAADVAAYAGMKTRLREKLARVRMFMDLWTGKTPKFLGEPVEIGK